jgi:hypothetical protein
MMMLQKPSPLSVVFFPLQIYLRREQIFAGNFGDPVLQEHLCSHCFEYQRHLGNYHRQKLKRKNRRNAHGVGL